MERVFVAVWFSVLKHYTHSFRPCIVTMFLKLQVSTDGQCFDPLLTNRLNYAYKMGNDNQRLVGLDCGFEKIQISNPFLDRIWIENPFWWIVGLSPWDWIANPIHEITL